MDSNVYALVMAGGKGTRLWPESTAKKPKQYLSLINDKSLLTQTLDRFDSLIDKENRFIVTTEDQRELALLNSRNKINNEGLIFEPAGRNTAPCILLSIATLEAKFNLSDDDIIAVMPSDHVIINENGFHQTFNKALNVCRETDSITTIGISPHFPHTGYGYIKIGKEQGEGFKVDQFKEKPNLETATEYLKSGLYLWNAGMFLATLGRFKTEFQTYASELFSFYTELLESIKSDKDISDLYGKLPKDSIDYAIMEKSSKVSIVKADFDWNDLGSWEAMEAVLDKNGENTIIGENNGVYSEGAKGNIVYAPNKFVSLIDVNDLVVVSNESSLMVVPKSESQKVKHVVEFLKKENSDLL